ncbi:MAG: GNAT family N-acetyltransferase [Bacilli bacterium]|nr:GNAT family N-acetyltransferase [Bacilli bacterium]MDD4282785.1 GNAT family N-acetyltransferase [Bacilli bacterium]MDD4718349.1 GNAT family N-acetyltransferase [Bacilli bacterium]
MIKRAETLLELKRCDELLNKLILDEKKYDNNIVENFVVRNYFSTIIKNKNNILLIKVIDDVIVGYIFAKMINSDTENNLGYLIDGLYVEKEFRNQKIAKSLINKVIEMCILNKVSYIDINVMYKNELAKQLYKSLKFEEFRITLRKKII